MADRDPLPPTDVSVTRDRPTQTQHRVTVTVKRDGTNHGEPKSITGEGETTSEAIRDSYKKFLDDPSSAEYIRKG
jgi:hypothetical protein